MQVTRKVLHVEIGGKVHSTIRAFALFLADDERDMNCWPSETALQRKNNRRGGINSELRPVSKFSSANNIAVG